MRHITAYRMYYSVGIFSYSDYINCHKSLRIFSKKRKKMEKNYGKMGLYKIMALGKGETFNE